MFLKSKIFNRIIIGVVTLSLVVGGSLWQQRILNVQATVQVLLVSRTAIAFGNVYPGENLSETYTVQLDTSAPDAVYHGRLEPVAGKLNLCPLLVIKSLDQPAEADVFATSTVVKFKDVLDKWQVGLKTPALKGEVAQDHEGNVVVKSGQYACKIVITTRQSEGCSPGFWKQKQHFKSWFQVSPSAKFSSQFENAFPGKTLEQVLGQGGGGLEALGRQTVAALLNASNPKVNSHFSAEEVKKMFNAVYPGKKDNYEKLKDQLEYYNVRQCPL